MDINGRDYIPIELFCALYGRNGVFTALDGSYLLNMLFIEWGPRKFKNESNFRVFSSFYFDLKEKTCKK